jgi:hypothetical protein
MEWVLKYWEIIVIGILVLDKIVAVTPNKYDDLILTAIKSAIGQVFGKKIPNVDSK